jgi:hypothetical protein
VPIPKNCEKLIAKSGGGGFSQPTVGAESHGPVGNIRLPRRVGAREGVRQMLGKLAGAWIGSKVARKNEAGKGAILGAGAVVVGKRVLPAIAALALGGWAFKTWRDRRRAEPSYPAEATPRIPASETSSPS